MDVILLEKTAQGNIGDVISVKAGYARNYLIPYSKALIATKENIASLEVHRQELEKQAAVKFAAAEQRASALNALTVSVTTQASEEGKLFGSIGTIEIARAINDAGVDVAKREIVLPEGPIHVVGEYEINVQVHADVVAKVTVNIVAAK